MKVMIIAAHADDEVLGAGGAIARHVAAGDAVRVVICADCRTVRQDWLLPEMHPAAVDAARVLGVEDPRFLGRHGMTLGDGPELKLIQAIEKQLRDFQPATVYTHHAHDLNSDHRAVSRAVMVATRPYGAHQPGRVLHFEVPSSTGWETPASFSPNSFVELSEALLQKKLDAMACYAEELRPGNHPRSLAALRTRAAYWGQLCGCAYAEPFQLMREVLR